MNIMRTDIVIITPIFFGDGSGAAVYYRLLANCLLDEGYTVSVISDMEAGDFQGQYYGLFPQRCGREKKFPRDVLAYAIQNLKYLSIPEIIRREQPCTLLVHSSFYNFPGVFPWVLRFVRWRCPQIRLIADMRDRLLPSKRMNELKLFDQVIACSENVAEYLIKHALDEKVIERIPVIQKEIDVDHEAKEKLLCELGLVDKPYIFYAGLVKETKGVDVLLEVFLQYIRKRKPNILLVIAGLLKTSDGKIIRNLQQKGVVYLGNRSRDEVLMLMSGASVCVNLSPNEGMPRSSLEALALKRPCLLPPNVPEFNKQCLESVSLSTNLEGVADEVLDILRSERVPSYSIEAHLANNVIFRYLKTLFRT